MMYATVHGTNTYIHSLKEDNLGMYAFVKGKPTYTKQDTVRARVNPRNLDERINTCYQEIGDT
jgi:hypothetical protein